MPRLLAVSLLLICTLLWGFAFIAQKSAMDSMGPLTFTGIRYILAALVILPVALFERRRKGGRLTRNQWIFILAMSVAFFMGAWLQQVGLATTTVTNAGVLTGLYVFFVPAIALIFLRTPPHPVVWICVPLALLGIYYLNGGGLDSFNSGDGLVICSAAFYAMHVLMIGYIARASGMPIFVSCISFVVAGAIASGFTFALETPTLSGIAVGWLEIAYAGVLSTALAYTLQAVGQQYVPSANAAIILSLESLFAALGGALLLGERLPPIGYAGATLIFVAVILVEAVPAITARRRAAVGV